ncbi:hypothetical protein BC938DRAFT_476037 [Jimgerdemannia flammicorona]|uniref:Uncharacterized protein n=1 Tax=Jimgerdemannia flammicorona TaxID=994334 RepID=A0A433QR07_9FUNG|nr:hypothetical protein BC938DRAFT_476037 [Jimgerdemannia flammicorona]
MEIKSMHARYYKRIECVAETLYRNHSNQVFVLFRSRSYLSNKKANGDEADVADVGRNDGHCGVQVKAIGSNGRAAMGSNGGATMGSNGGAAMGSNGGAAMGSNGGAAMGSNGGAAMGSNGGAAMGSNGRAAMGSNGGAAAMPFSLERELILNIYI